MLENYLTIVTHPLLWMFIGLTVVFFGVQGLVGRSAEAPTAPDDRIRRLAEKVGMKGLHPVLFLILLLTWGIVAGTLFAGLYAILWQVIFHAPPEGTEDVWNWRFTLAQLVALTTVLGAVIALPITINRLILTRRQTDTVEQGHITDRINKAVEGLGAEKTKNRMGRTIKYTEIKDQIEREFETFEWQEAPFVTQGKQLTNGPEFGPWTLFAETEPNLEVRIGAIYALERISQDSERDHIQIMEILCAYIRQNAGHEDVSLPEGDPTPKEWQVWARERQQYPRLDIDVALKVIERRHADRKQRERNKGYRLGLERAQLPKIILSRRDLAGADLRKADLKGTNLECVDFQGAMLENAQLQGAYLGCASLQNAYLARAQLQGSNLEGAALQRAVLDSADLQFTYLPDVQFQGAVLAGAKLHNAYLWGVEFDKWVNLSTASFLGAAIRATDCTEVPSLS